MVVKMAVLDSSFLIDFCRKRAKTFEIYKGIKESGGAIFVTSISLMELWEGALKSEFPEKEKLKVEEMLASLRSLDFDFSAAQKAAELNITLKDNPLEVTDIMIAAIAMTHGETLVTRDEHFARIPGLSVLKY